MAIAPGGSGSMGSDEPDTADSALPVQVPETSPQAVIAPDTAAVDVRDYVFEDQASGTSHTTIALGGTVTWTVSWGDHSITHTLARPYNANPGVFFNSGIKCSYDCGKGDTYTHTFDLPGVHTYYCLVHPEDMQGTVTVVA